MKKNILIAILIVVVIILFFKNSDLKYKLLYEEKSIPDIELINYLSFNSNGVASGQATGFVLFDDIEKQPRDLRQYMEITASESFDKNGRQIFFERDIIKMNSLPPRYFEAVPLTIKNVSGRVITLTDSSNNLFFIDTSSKEISTLDATGDATTLITSSLDYQDFMIEFLK